MDGRKRTVQLKFRVTEAERNLILEKMKLIPTRNMAAYLRKIAIDGYIIQIDHSDIKAMTAEIQRYPEIRGAIVHSDRGSHSKIRHCPEHEQCRRKMPR